MPNYLVYKAGMASVGQYQMSAIPYATASLTVPALGSAPQEISFPRISKFVTVRNIVSTGSADRTFRVGFSSQGTSGSVPGSQNFFTLANGESYTGEWRIQSVFLLCDTGNQSSASVIAGLTAISTASLGFDNWSGSLGVG
jgi:hypothetical protein